MQDPLALLPQFDGIASPRRRKKKYKKKKSRVSTKSYTKKTKVNNKKNYRTRPRDDVCEEHTRSFHSKKHKIDGVILGTLTDGEIVYGEQALKARFPKYLQRHTQDYDVFASNPKKEALEAERKLDKAFGGDYFFVKEAAYPGTYKVVAHANREGYADFSKKPKKKIPHDKIKGRKYIKLSEEVKARKKSLRDPESEWRHGKDRDALNRIKIYKKKYKKRK